MLIFSQNLSVYFHNEMSYFNNQSIGHPYLWIFSILLSKNWLDAKRTVHFLNDPVIKPNFHFFFVKMEVLFWSYNVKCLKTCLLLYSPKNYAVFIYFWFFGMGQFLLIFYISKLSMVDIKKRKKGRQTFRPRIGALFSIIN